VPPESFVQALKLRLGEWLPGYMIPESYVKVAMIPRAPNGRAEYESLPIPERPPSSETPSRAVSTVQSIAADLLHVPHVGTDANLADLGLDSLKAALLASRLDAAFGAAPHVCQVLTGPTVAAISQSLLTGSVSW
jgi:hypothetical protein